MLFALLKGSLNNSPAVCDIFTDTTSQEWEECYFSASNRGGHGFSVGDSPGAPNYVQRTWY